MDISKGRTFLLVVTIGSAYMTWSMLIALQPSFYPTEAEKKGAKPYQYGSVFGSAHLAAFFIAPVFGKYGTFSLKTVLHTSVFLQGICGIGFGCLDFWNDTLGFLCFSYLLRIIGGAADASAMGAMLTILMQLYPGKTGQIITWTGSASGLGHMIGPPLGSFLYTFGGFTLPFFFVGSISLILGVGLYLVIPEVKADRAKEVDDSPEDDERDANKKIGFLNVFKCPSIILPLLDNFVSVSGTGIIDSMLEPFMKKETGATQMDVGIAFLLLGLLYMIGNPFAGWACDRLTHSTLISICGHLVMVIVFIFIGPLPFIQIVPNKMLTQTMVGLFGLGYAFVKVSSFVRSQNAAIKNGFNKDIETSNFISGIWTGSFFLGNFFGPTLAGFLVEQLGFPWASLVFLLINCFVLIADLIELVINVTFNRLNQYLKVENQ